MYNIVLQSAIKPGDFDGVTLGVAVFVGVILGVLLGVTLGVAVTDGVLLGVAVIDGVGEGDVDGDIIVVSAHNANVEPNKPPGPVIISWV